MKKSIVAIFIFLMIINFVTPVCAVINEDKSEKIILIDPGHGGIDGGAKSKNGTIENCMDADIHMIQNEKIDEISKVINEDFERLLELQTTNEESVVF